MKRAAFFDIDRTLYTGVLAVDFVEAIKSDDDATKILDQLAIPKEVGVVEVLRGLQASGKMPLALYMKIARDVGVKARGKFNIFPLSLFKSLRKEGYCLVALSQAPSVVLKEYCRDIDGDSFDLINSPMPTVVYSGSLEYLGPKSTILQDERDKADWVEVLAKCHGFDLGNSTAIGDSVNDLPMLRAVGGRKIAYNPKDDLRVVAESESWEVINEASKSNGEK